MKEKGVTREISESTGEIEKILKRRRAKREGGKEKEAFRSSKKTVRSPDIEEGN